MKIFKDIVSNEEMFSDLFPMKEEYDGVIYKVQSSYKSADKVGEIDIGCGNEFGGGEPDAGGEEEPTEKVIDVVYNTKLETISISKKEFMSYIKRYFAKVVEYLNKNGKSDRVDVFKKGATEFTKFIIKKFDDIEIYVPSSKSDADVDEMDFGVAISYWEDDSAAGPVFCFFKDGLIEEKC